MFIFISAISEDDILYSEIHDRYYKYAYKICLKKVNDYDSIEEILNMAFYKVFVHLDKTQPEKAIKGFIATVVNNEINNYLKQLYRQPQEVEFFDDVKFNENEWENLPLENMVVSEGVNTIYEEIGNLSPKISETMVLLLINHLSVNEIAATLDVPAKTVYSRIILGQKQLKKKLSEKNFNDINQAGGE